MSIHGPRILATAALVAGLASTPALAHTPEMRTSPRANTVVKTLPNVVTVTFGEQIGRVMSIRVTRRGSRMNYVRSFGVDKRMVTRARATLRPVGPAGRYTVQWKIRAADGHVQSGTYAFRTLKRG